MLEKPKFLDEVRVKNFSYSRKTYIDQVDGRSVGKISNKKPDTIFTVIGVTNFKIGRSIYIGPEEGYSFQQTGNVQVFIVANTIGIRHKVQLEDLELVVNDG